jgi:heptose-I-phosphate ethanolaminephosphotransferase
MTDKRIAFNYTLLAKKKWAFCLIFFLLLINPVFYFWADDITLKDKCIWWIACVAVGLAFSGIDLFLKKRTERFCLCILFLLSIVPNAVVWSYLYLSSIYMRRDMYWVIFNSHATESIEFFDHFISWKIVLAVCVYIGLGIFFLVKAYSTQAIAAGKHRVLLASSMLLVLASIYFQYLSQAIPTFELYKSYFFFWIENRIFEREKEFRLQLTMDVQCHLPDSAGHVFVILLGESTTTCHMSLYGYFRQTTPLMEMRREELDIYTDVVTPDTHTYGVMQKVLTFANHRYPEYYKKKASIVELFNVAGFETHWIGNSAFMSKWGASYGVIAQQAQYIYDLSIAHQTDEIVIPPLKKILEDDGTNGNKVIFIHLMGNHHAYNSRYPESFEHFDYRESKDLTDKGFRNHRMKKTIDEYDNSILYGDFVYDSILKEIEKADVSSYLLFFSDHGEEVFDTRAVSGHLMSNVYPCQCQIPFVLWRSEKYRKENPDIVVDTTRSYSIEDVIYSISTLSKLEYEENDRSLSIFSPEYAAPSLRMVGNEKYENILEKK